MSVPLANHSSCSASGRSGRSTLVSSDGVATATALLFMSVRPSRRAEPLGVSGQTNYIAALMHPQGEELQGTQLGNLDERDHLSLGPSDRATCRDFSTVPSLGCG
jgi:hypothetical protein